MQRGGNGMQNAAGTVEHQSYSSELLFGCPSGRHEGSVSETDVLMRVPRRVLSLYDGMLRTCPGTLSALYALGIVDDGQAVFVLANGIHRTKCDERTDVVLRTDVGVDKIVHGG